jgi:hypothetical protein
MGPGVDPITAPKAPIDRFADGTGSLFLRSQSVDLPGPNQPIDFDQGPFVTRGLGPDGGAVRYYNFDVQPARAIPIYVLFHAGESSPIEGQLNVIDAVPGDPGYSDFWQVHRVTVPDDYVVNSITSAAEIEVARLPTELTDTIVNCPIVPDGSTATLRGGAESAELHEGWYRDTVVKYFTFEEAAVTASEGAEVPVSPIFVSFNVNPDQPGGGPASGFRSEIGSDQTHNVVASLPGGADYSPLWSVQVYDNADFDLVSDLESINDVTIVAMDVATVNCPLVER